MVKGIGTDIIDLKRISKSIEQQGFCKKVFTESEIAYCESKKNKAEHYGARFAAKEAFFKAMGTGWREGMAWKDISVENNELGKPEIFLTGLTERKFYEMGFTRIMLSMSHIKEYAVAFVVFE